MRRWWWVILLILVLIGLGYYWFVPPVNPPRWNEEVVSGSGPDKIALIQISGIITPEPSSSWGGMTPPGADDWISQLEQAQADPAVKAIVLDLETPGGDVVTTDRVYQALLDFKDQSSKPVVAAMGTVAASGGFYLAMAADEVFAGSNTITGSIGVISQLPEYRELAETIGFGMRVFKSGPLKDMGSPLRPITTEEAAVFQALVDQAYGRFVEVVAAGTEMSEAEVRPLADGRIYTGAQAQQLGLIDEIGYQDKAITRAAELARAVDPLVVRYYQPVGFAELFWGMLGPKPGPAEVALNSVLPSAPLEYRWLGGF
jgi:protease-4